jgi:hypothetical protein
MSMPLLLLSIAAEVLNLDDIAAAKRRARTLLDGPDRCIELQAEAKDTIVIMSPGGLFGSPRESTYTASGTVFGRLDHGVWTSWGPPLHDDRPDDDVALGAVTARPMVGKTPEHEGDPEHHGSVSVSSSGDVALASSGPQAANLLDEVLDEVDPEVTVAYVEPDTQGWALVEQADIAGQEDDLDMRWHIDPTGLPTALDVTFPKRMQIGDGAVKARVLNGQLHLRGQTNELGTLPVSESLSVVVGVLGFTVGVEQEIRYVRARPCQ